MTFFKYKYPNVYNAAAAVGVRESPGVPPRPCCCPLLPLPVQDRSYRCICAKVKNTTVFLHPDSDDQADPTVGRAPRLSRAIMGVWHLLGVFKGQGRGVEESGVCQGRGLQVAA